MGFGRAHVWKMSHLQAMEFFHTQKLGCMEGCGVPPSHIISVKNSLSSKPYARKKYVPPQSAHTLGSPFTCLPAAAVDKLTQIPTITLLTDFHKYMCVTWLM